MPVPADAVPVLIAVVAYFATFMVVVGGVLIWTRGPAGQK
jgi:hypothetical protein